MHLAFKLPISYCNSFVKMIDFVSKHWKKRKIFLMITKWCIRTLYLQLSGNLTASFLWKRKKIRRQQNILDQLCDKIVDAIGETFTKKYYLVKIFQSKKGHVYLVVRKKRGRLFGKELLALHRMSYGVSKSVFAWFCSQHDSISEHYFFFILRS